MFLGIDLGTSAVKALLLDGDDRVVAEASAPLAVSRPHPLWSEQDPDAWWQATEAAVAGLRDRAGAALGEVAAVGLSGQMHGATLLDAADRPLRPAILWNDGRSAEACAALEARVPALRKITGNLAMPGFTAPKLVWVHTHEPEVFGRVARVLLPKDYLRLRMTGEYATDMADAAGTLWLDVGRRCWSGELLAACALDERAMPKLYEGPEPTGRLRREVAEAWGVPAVPVVAGGGDQAAGAVGAGVVAAGDALLSLGTSGVYFVAGDRFQPAPENAVHAFCHALPSRWHQMSVLLSAASCVAWVTRLVGAADEASLLAEVEAADATDPRLLFLPYLSGERTPHNDPHASGVFVGLGHETDAKALARAVLEGVAFAFGDAERVLREAGATIDRVSVIGGGARSHFWGRILASALARPLVYRSGGEVGPALGAARLARLGAGDESVESVCRPLPEAFVAEPDPNLVDRYAEAQVRFRALYPQLQPSFDAASRLEATNP